MSRAANDPSVFTITEKALTSAFAFKTLLRHYAKQAPKNGVSRHEIRMPTQLS